MECIEWGGATDAKGYGICYARRFGKLIRRAHVLAWIDANGRLPLPGEQVRHTCDNPPCINPVHLLIGSAKDNSQDAVSRGRLAQQRKTHCPKGHPYEGNSYSYETPAGGKNRLCKICAQARAAAQRARGPVDPATVRRTKTHCKRGHELTTDNVYLGKNGGRTCKTCALERGRKS
jgi:hypothetical protein